MKNHILYSFFPPIGRSVAKIVIVILCGQSFDGFSQSREFDSLKSLMANGVISNHVDDLYMTSVELMLKGQFDSARILVNRLYLLGEQEGDSLQIVRALATSASILRRQGLLDSAMTIYHAALIIAKRRSYSEQRKNILNSIGLLYVLEARYDVALKCLLESLELRQQTADKYELGVAYHNIGLVYYKLENYDKALSYYDRSWTVRSDIKRRDDIDLLLLNIGWCYIHKGEHDTAHKYIEAAFAECDNMCSNKFLADAFLGLGYIARNQEEFATAEKHFINSYSLATKQNDVRQALDNINQLSEIYIYQNKTVLAEKYLAEAEKLSTSDNRYRLELAGIYRQFSDLYGRTNNLKRKVYFQDQYIALKDSIFNHEVTSNLMKAESGYVERESKARKEAQSKIMKLKDEIMFRQRVANIAFALVALFGITLTIMLARRNKAKQITNLLLDQKVIERTRELRINQELIQLALEQKALLVHKATSELHSLIATTKGLCFLGRQEMDINRCREYWRRLDATTDGMRSTVAKLSDFQKNQLAEQFPIEQAPTESFR